MSSAGTTTSSCTSTAAAPVGESFRAAAAARFADYLELTRPRIAVLSLLTVTVGYVLAAGEVWRVVPLLHALLGITFVAAGSSALNQFLERTTDGRMDRTANRPLPAGRMSPAEVFLFGLTFGAGGCLYLLFLANATTAILAAVTLLLYVLVYTPLKRRTSLCTLVGAIPGALPPVLGWTAAGGSLDSGAFALFGILFLWQFPHFLAIAWLYRRQYRGAGLRMLPGEDKSHGVAGLLAVGYALALLPMSLLPGGLAQAESLAGERYTICAFVLGAGYLVFSVRFFLNESKASARGLLWASLIYLPLLLMALTWDHFLLLR